MLVAKNPPSNSGDVGDMSSILGSGKSPGGGHGNPIQHACVENSMDRGVWQAMVHGISELDMSEVAEHQHLITAL